MLACAACGVENPDAARFCMACANPLRATLDRREERKVVTVLFADLVGFTSRSERLDIEDVRGTLKPYHATLRRALERFGGTVEKFIGDAVMAVFGAPAAREDDPERAVRAALAIHDSIADLDADLHVRIGVCTGEALVALDAQPERGEGMVSGDIVNTASRLQDHAPVDGVLVCAATYQATERAIVYDAHEPVVAKGKAEPVPCWVARRPRAFIPTTDRDAVQLVGRQRELRMVIDALGRSRAEPSVQLVTVVGVPGIGKTRLVAEVRAHVDDAPEITAWRQGHVLSYGEGVAFWALAEIVKQQAGILESDDAPTIAAKLDAAIGGVALTGIDAVWVRRQLAALVGIESTGERGGRDEAYAGWRMFIEAMAAERPTVLVVDDLHWADDPLLDFIDELAERVTGVPLLIIATTRPELWERRPGWGGGKSNALTISLQKLSRDETQELIAILIDPTLLTSENEQELLSRADGNPLYAQEYVRTVVERGAGAAALPASVQGIIAARLDALSADEKSLLQDAAVFGRTAWLGALCAVGGRDAAVADALAFRLERKQLLRRVRRSSVAGEIELTFAHGLIEEVAYGQLTREQRYERHERAADWIVQLSSDRTARAEIVAYHLATALKLRTALGKDTAELRARTLSTLVAALRQATSRYDHAATIALAVAALALDPEPDIRAELLVSSAAAHERVGAVTEAMLIEARDAALATGRREDAVYAAWMLAAWVDDQASDMVKFDRCIGEALELAATLPPGPITGLPAYLRGYRLLVQGQYEELLSFADIQIAKAREAGDEQAAALMLVWRGPARVNLGDPNGVDDNREGCAILDRYAHPKVAVQSANLAEAYLNLGRLDASDAAAKDGLVWARRIGDQRVEMIQLARLALTAYHRGNRVEAQDLLDSAAALGPQGGSADTGLLLTRCQLSYTEAPHEAIIDAERALEFVDANANDEGRLEVYALLARLHDTRGNHAAAQSACDSYLARWHALHGMQMQILTLLDASIVLAAAERHNDIAAAVALVTAPSPWADAIRALADRRYADAAAILDASGAIALRDAVNGLSSRS